MRQQLFRYSVWLLVWGSCLQACRPIPQKSPSRGEGVAQSLDFEQLRLSVAITYQDGEQRYSNIRVRLRIKKDSLIWFAVLTPLGTEALRGIITPTGITLINHTEKAYYVYSYATLRSLWPGPWDYASLQALLLGEVDGGKQQKIVQLDADQMVMQCKEAGWAMTYFIGARSGKLERLVASTKSGSFSAIYEDFKPYPEGVLLGKATLTWYNSTAPTQPTATVTMKGMRIKRAKGLLKFPFAIPTHYQKR